MWFRLSEGPAPFTLAALAKVKLSRVLVILLLCRDSLWVNFLTLILLALDDAGQVMNAVVNGMDTDLIDPTSFPLHFDKRSDTLPVEVKGEIAHANAQAQH